MNIIILKWVLTDLMTCKPQDGTAILHAVLQLDASGSVTKPSEKCYNLIVALEQIPDRLATRHLVRDGRAPPN